MKTNSRKVESPNNKWLDVVLNGKLVEINSKGKTRRKKRRG